MLVFFAAELWLAGRQEAEAEPLTGVSLRCPYPDFLLSIAYPTKQKKRKKMRLQNRKRWRFSVLQVCFPHRYEYFK